MIVVGEFPVLAAGDACIDVRFKGLIQQGRGWVTNGFGPRVALFVPQLALSHCAGVLGVSVSNNVSADQLSCGSSWSSRRVHGSSS